MQRNILNKFNKRILCILILFVMIYTMFSFIPQLMNKSYAKTYTYSKDSNNLPSNFESTYPGYKSLLENLVKKHPKWTFKIYETGLNWNTVIDNEYTGTAKNLSPKNYPVGWICPICKDEVKDTGAWKCASEEAVKYMIDPRNSLNTNDAFQFLLLSNDKNITKTQVKTMASKISYLNNQKIIDAIYEAASELNINPFYIIGKILQEQGSGASALCSGQGYKGQYVGYYNLFNVGASGNTEKEVILNGLKYAKSKGWNTPKKAIIGGIGLIKSYIQRGQDTLYYQKFNVTYKPYYVSQYAQNVLDAQNIGVILRGYYEDAKLIDSEFIFEIPLYKNMPSKACINPTKLESSPVKGELAYINASSLKLRKTANGEEIDTLGRGEKVIIKQRATSKINGSYWDEVYTHVGTGYMARAATDESKTYLVPANTDYKIEDNNIIVTPSATMKTINKGTNLSNFFGTGSKIKLYAINYKLVMLGDVDGNGEVDIIDMALVKRHISDRAKLSGKNLKAGILQDNAKDIDIIDMALLKRHISGKQKITL